MSPPQTWHIVTSEYPPHLGGVADFSAVAAAVLAERGEQVHVWTGGVPANAGPDGAVTVHRTFGTFGAEGLRRTSAELDASPGPRTLLVQWVPHGYSPRGMNLRFALWLRQRAHAGDRLLVVVHEPFVSDVRRPSHIVIAALQRLMAAVVLRSADDVFITIPAWREALRRWAFGRKFSWKLVPLPPSIAVNRSGNVAAIRGRFAGPGMALIGHFGACGGPMQAMLLRSVPAVLHARSDVLAVLIGRDSDRAVRAIEATSPDLRGRVFAAGALPPDSVSLHLQACDLLLQPYPDGVSGRRTSVIAALDHGKAVVTTSGHLTEDFWRRSNAVALAPVDDVTAMTARCEELLGDPVARRELEKRAKEFADRHFNRDRLREVLS